MSNELNTEIETYYYAFLNKVIQNPSFLKANNGELQFVLNKLMLMNNVEKIKEIRTRTYSMMKLDPPPFTNSFIAIQEIRRVILDISQNNQAARANAAREIANETYVNRVKTSDKQQKEVIDFIKG